METNPKQSTENFVKEVYQKTRRVFTFEQKILIVMEAIRGELSAAPICRKCGIANTVFCKRNKEFMEAGKNLKMKTNHQTKIHSSSKRCLRPIQIAFKKLIPFHGIALNKKFTCNNETVYSKSYTFF
jgi:hypothetical protein